MIEMKNKKILLLLLITILVLTGCTKNLKDENNKIVINEVTGQNLTENILCQPTDEETIKIYKEHGVDIDSLPYCSCKTDKIQKEKVITNEASEEEIITEEVDCESFKISSGGYEGIWTTFFVKPLAFVILFFGILIILSLNMTVFESNLYYQAIGWAIIAIGIILILSGIMTDTLNRFNK